MIADIGWENAGRRDKCKEGIGEYMLIFLERWELDWIRWGSSKYGMV